MLIMTITIAQNTGLNLPIRPVLIEIKRGNLSNFLAISFLFKLINLIGLNTHFISVTYIFKNYKAIIIFSMYLVFLILEYLQCIISKQVSINWTRIIN